MIEFEPSSYMASLADQIDQLREEVRSQAIEQAQELLYRFGMEHPQHLITFHNSMGSTSVEISPPLVSADGEHELVVVIQHQGWQFDLPEFKDFLWYCDMLFALEQWVCDTTGWPFADLGELKSQY